MSTALGFCAAGLLASTVFTLATYLKPRTTDWTRRAQADGLMQRVFGEGRRLFANHFFTQADIYFHSGFYPSIFEQGSKVKSAEHLKHDGHAAESCADARHEHDGHDAAEHQGDKGDDSHADDAEAAHYREMAKSKPKDILEAFGRKFVVTSHKHLSAGNEREMLPWLKLSAEMDPQQLETYTVAAYWLQNMGKVDEAEKFLRLGLKNNPDSYEILTDLALLLERRKHDDFRAQNLLNLAFSKWQKHEAGKDKPDKVGADRILVRLAMIEKRSGKKEEAIGHLQEALKLSPSPDAIQKQLKELRSQ